MKADAVIIGGGVIGTAIARELSRYNLNIILIEKEDDVAMGTSKGNSGIIHAGYNDDFKTLKLEIMPFSTGLTRNKVQCLDDFDIPLRFNHTITRIEGRKRVEKVTIAQVDKNLQAIPGTEEEMSCDTILLSVGLIPENELTKEVGIRLDPVTGGPVVNENRETEIEGIFACGNVLHVHDLADYVSEEGEIVGKAVKEYLMGERRYRSQSVKIIPGENIGYVVPQHIDFFVPDRKKIKLFMRVKKPEERIRINLLDDKGRVLGSYKKRIVTPGEMVSVYLPEVLLDDKLKNITISIKRD